MIPSSLNAILYETKIFSFVGFGDIAGFVFLVSKILYLFAFIFDFGEAKRSRRALKEVA